MIYRGRTSTLRLFFEKAESDPKARFWEPTFVLVPLVPSAP
jgi:hypothetical protein